VAGCCECGDESSGSCATELVISDSCEPGSSVSIVPGYGLEEWAIEVRSPAEARDFSFNLCVHTGSGANRASVQWVPGVLCPELNRRRGVTLTTHPLLVPRSRMSRSYTSPPKCLCDV
jgi:hypothetical protein